MSEFRNLAPCAALLAAGGLIYLVGCSPGEAQPAPDQSQSQTQQYEGHFAAVCPEGTRAGILDVRTHGAVPTNPENKTMYADAAATVTCYGNNGQIFVPKLRQDANGGKCLGFKPNEYHVMLEVRAPKNTDVAFFPAAPDSDQVDIGIAKTERIERVEVHHHDLKYPSNKREFKNNGCEEKAA